jgi:hypothetical protein
MASSPCLKAIATLFLLSTLVTLPAAGGQKKKAADKRPQSAGTPLAEDEDARRIWADDATFAQLSSAAQMQLIRAFGPRPGAQAAPSVDRPFAANIAASPAFDNVLVNNPTGEGANDTQSETSCLISGNSIIVGFNDSGSNTTEGGHFTGWSVSTDGGVTFVDKGVLPNTTPGDAGDPVLARDNNVGYVYMTTLSFNTNDHIQFWRSTDNGQSFQAAISATPDARAGDSMDKEWLAVDNFPGPGQGNIYHIWRNFGGGATNGGMKFTRSTDGGASFGPIRPWVTIEAQAGQGGWVSVGPDHAVYCFWLSTGNIIKMRKSTDLGVTFGPALTVTTITSTGVNGDLNLGSFRSNTFPQIVNHPTNPAVLYAVFPDKGTTPDRADIFLVSSTDGGTTWSARQRVNDDAGTSDNWQPSLAITPDGSRLFVGYYTREFDPSNTMIDTKARVGTTSGGTVVFDPSQRVTTASFPVEHGHDPAVNPSYMGDYDHATADNQFFYYTWGDNRDRNTSNTRFNNNVRFAKIPAAGGPVAGADTPGIYAAGTAAFFLRNSNSSGPADIVSTFGGAGNTPIVGDWDGDGDDTLGIYVPSTSTFFLRNSNSPGAADLTFGFGAAGSSFVPVVGDFDGNGTTTAGLYDPATGNFFLKNSNTPGAADVVFSFGAGGAGLVPLAGDWDGNGTDTVAVYNPTTGAFFLRNANAPGPADVVFTFGGAGLKPLAGDWNGDGTDTVAVYAAAGGVFFLKNSNTPGAADLTFGFGAGGGVIALAGDWDGL